MGPETGFLGDMVSRLRGAFRTNLFRNSFFLLLRSSLSYFLGFLFWLVVARTYLPKDVGVAAALLSLVLLLARAAALGLPLGILRFLPAETNKPALINAAFTASGLAAIGIGVAFFAGLDLWAPAVASVRGDTLLVAGLFFSLVFFAMDGILDNAFVAARRADYGLVRTTIFYGLRLPLAVALMAFGLLGIVTTWALSLVVSVIAAGLLLPRFFPGYRPRPALRPLRHKGLLGFSLWSYGTGVVAGAASSLLPLLVINRLGSGVGEEASAHFYAAFAIASLLYNVPHSFSTSLLVEGSYEEIDYPAERRRSLRYSGPLVALGIAGAILLGRPILGLFGESYAANGYETLVLLVLASPIMLVTGIFSADLQVGKRARPIFFVTTLSTIVTLLVAVLAMPVAGVLGVALGVISGQATKLLMYFLVRQHRFRRVRTTESSA